MKKLLVLSLVALSGVYSGFSQGSTVYFGNNVTFATAATQAANGHSDRLVYYTDNTALVGTNWLAQLYYASGSSQLESSLHTLSGDIAAKFRAAGTTVAGTWSPSQVQKVLPDVAVGAVATLQVRVWDGTVASTYELAAANAANITGKSAVFNYTTQPTTGTAVFMEGLQSFTLSAAPEPTTIALGVLGAASLLVVRRRKQ